MAARARSLDTFDSTAIVSAPKRQALPKTKITETTQRIIGALGEIKSSQTDLYDRIRENTGNTLIRIIDTAIDQINADKHSYFPHHLTALKLSIKDEKLTSERFVTIVGALINILMKLENPDILDFSKITTSLLPNIKCMITLAHFLQSGSYVDETESCVDEIEKRYPNLFANQPEIINHTIHYLLYVGCVDVVEGFSFALREIKQLNALDKDLFKHWVIRTAISKPNDHNMWNEIYNAAASSLENEDFEEILAAILILQLLHETDDSSAPSAADNVDRGNVVNSNLITHFGKFYQLLLPEEKLGIQKQVDKVYRSILQLNPQAS